MTPTVKNATFKGFQEIDEKIAFNKKDKKQIKKQSRKKISSG